MFSRAQPRKFSPSKISSYTVLLGCSIVTAQTASPTFTPVYIALVAIVNTKVPQISELIIIVNFKFIVEMAR